MPPKNASGTKRKAPLATPDSNAAPPAKRAAKSANIAPSTATKTYKYSEPSSLEKELPEVCTVEWDFDEDDESEDEEEEEEEDDGGRAKERGGKGDKPGDKEPLRVPTKEGFPITKAGFEKSKHIFIEQEKRDPDLHDLYIYNDFAGYGMAEVLENALIEFNKILFKKDISPLTKWSHVEGILTWLYAGDSTSLMMSDDSSRVDEIFSLLPTLMTTALDLLSEHALIAPTSAVPNATFFVLILIKFLQNEAEDFQIEGAERVVQAADRVGLVWDFRREIGVTEEDIEALRQEGKLKGKKAALADWKKEWPAFKRNHPGGKKFDITKMSKAQKKEHALGGGSGGGDDWPEAMRGAGADSDKAAFLAKYGSEFGDIFD